MKALLRRLDEAIAGDERPWKRHGSMVEVEVSQGGHRQKVHFERVGDRYRLWSIAASAAFVTRSDRAWRDLAYRAWRKNSLKEIVGFSFTPQDGNPLLSTVAAMLWYLDESTMEDRLDILRRYLFPEI